jgi:hypothetical protein
MQTFHLSEIIEDPVDNKGNSIDDILDSNSKHAIIDINLGAQRGIAIIDITFFALRKRSNFILFSCVGSI